MLQRHATIYLTEDELTDVLRYLPDDHKLRNHLQEAGNNIFDW